MKGTAARTRPTPRTFCRCSVPWWGVTPAPLMAPGRNKMSPQATISFRQPVPCLVSVCLLFVWFCGVDPADSQSLDTFNPNPGPASEVYAIAVQGDGQILMAGNGFLNRVHSDGSPDASFNLQNGQVMALGV